MNSELLPCPFCGGEKVVPIIKAPYGLEVRQENNRAVLCSDCGALSCFFRTKQEAIDAWNTRAERTCKMHPTTIGNKRHTATIHEYECLSCECLVVTYACDEKPRYCPHCGAKVVE